ncbi:MAG: ATP-binding cassette domain-containing protein [Actinobacteria bacterium]|nr:ATP-binding cassette domain-containing protein [Actinomycetota bacterium]
MSRSLAVESATVSFGGVDAVRSVSLTLHPGEIVGLIGPNGAGKTTLMNVTSGLQKASSGRVLIDDVDVTSWPPFRRARHGLSRTFQDVRLFLYLTVFENAHAGALGVGQDPVSALDTTSEMLKRFGLEALADDLAVSLNHVEQRRLAIARALTARPSYLLLDEPGAGLSEGETDDLLNSLVSVRNDLGCGLLVIEHDMRLIMRLCDRIQVLNDGATIAIGTPEQIQADPQVHSAYLGV